MPRLPPLRALARPCRRSCTRGAMMSPLLLRNGICQGKLISPPTHARTRLLSHHCTPLANQRVEISMPTLVGSRRSHASQPGCCWDCYWHTTLTCSSQVEQGAS